MTRLSVNINKVATLRNARGGNNPDVCRTAIDLENMGAQGITVHPRPDERHIRLQDVFDLHEVVRTELNIEGYPDERLLGLIERVVPAQATLVPDAPSQITSSSGWDTRANLEFLTGVVARIHKSGVRVSIFVAPDIDMVECAARAGADRVELYTEPYAAAYAHDPAEAVAPYVEAAECARSLKLGLNAGHDLSLVNLRYLHSSIPWLDEVSIGQALICDALYLGYRETLRRYLSCLD